MRSVTERTEAIESGAVKLIGTSRDEIVRSVSEFLDDAGVHLRAASVTSPYGDGRSSQRIVKRLLGEPCDEFVPGSPRDEGDA
jgi:UDP-N-acetylglucosamine 2-epimerase (non-hydrolysing)